MKLDRISAVIHSRPSQARAGQGLPAAGQSLLLTYDDVHGNDVLATMSNGLALRLAGLGRWQRDLQPGDTLRVRVLASDPVLELEVEGKPGRAAAADADADANTSTMSRHAAMRLDQAALRQMAWQAPNAAALALSWRNLALERWGAGVPAREAAGEVSAATLTTMLGPAPFREPASTLPPPNLERWLFPVYAWGGMQMMLGLGESGDDAAARRQGRRRNLALRLELAPAALGRVVLHVQWMSGGIQLQIAVERVESVQLVRDVLPVLTTALTRAGLRLTRFRLTQGSAAVAGLREGPDLLQVHFATQASSLLLFRALTETAVVLLQVVPDHLSQASR